MKTYLVKVLQTYEETYLIETETEKNAIYLSVSNKLKPEKTKHIKSDITEVKELWKKLKTQWQVVLGDMIIS